MTSDTMQRSGTWMKYPGAQPGIIQNYDDDFVYYTSSGANGDPAATFETDIAPGTLWVRTDNSNNIYVFVTQEELDMYGKVSGTDYVPADSNFAQGGWVMAYNWWFRSPNLGGPAYFWYSYTNGGLYNGNAGYAYGVSGGFSI